MTNDDRTANWAHYYENQKKLWYDPTIHPVVKCVIRIVELHRSDSKGWCLSVRKIANLLGIAPRTASATINYAIKNGYIESNSSTQRVRRKLRLSVSLRAPVEHETDHLAHWQQQPVPAAITKTVSSGASVNRNTISNSIESPLEQQPTEKTITSWDSPGRSLLRETVNRIGRTKETIS